MAFFHKPVLIREVVELLRPGPGKRIVDGTLGGGGHAEALLEAGADVLGIDRDPEAILAARQRLSGFGSRFVAREGNFGDLARISREAGWPVTDGVLLDLGVSSAQLDRPERGFSFQADGPLDMRQGREGPTAAELIRTKSESELADLLRALGEEPFARPVARELKRARPGTTLEAAAAVARAVPRARWPKRIHVATRTFQALRMAVNNEVECLAAALASLESVLGPGGVAAVISFHSLEDRAVKQAFRELVGLCRCPPGLPVCACGRRGRFKNLTPRSRVPGAEEVATNPRARSARLRAVEKAA